MSEINVMYVCFGNTRSKLLEKITRAEARYSHAQAKYSWEQTALPGKSFLPMPQEPGITITSRGLESTIEKMPERKIPQQLIDSFKDVVYPVPGDVSSTGNRPAWVYDLLNEDPERRPLQLAELDGMNVVVTADSFLKYALQGLMRRQGMPSLNKVYTVLEFAAKHVLGVRVQLANRPNRFLDGRLDLDDTATPAEKIAARLVGGDPENMKFLPVFVEDYNALPRAGTEEAHNLEKTDLLRLGQSMWQALRTYAHTAPAGAMIG